MAGTCRPDRRQGLVVPFNSTRSSSQTGGYSAEIGRTTGGVSRRHPVSATNSTRAATHSSAAGRREEDHFHEEAPCERNRRSRDAARVTGECVGVRSHHEGPLVLLRDVRKRDSIPGNRHHPGLYTKRQRFLGRKFDWRITTTISELLAFSDSDSFPATISTWTPARGNKRARVGTLGGDNGADLHGPLTAISW